MKKVVTTILLAICFVCISNASFATSSIKATFDLTGDSVQKKTVPINPGEVIKLKLSISDINIDTTEAAYKAITKISTVLDYDKNIFEQIEADAGGNLLSTSKSTVVPASNWINPRYAQKFDRIIITAQNGVESGSSDVLEYHLKVKDNVTAKQTVVTLKNIEASSGADDITHADIPVTIGSNTAPTQVPTPTPTPTAVPTQVPTPTPTPVQSNKPAIASFVFDAENQAKASKTLKAGDTIKFKLKLSDIKIDKGVASLYAILDYDKSVFELIGADTAGKISSTSKSTITKLGTWEDPVYNTNTNQFTMRAGGWKTEDNEVCEFTFKIKEDTKAEETTIKLKDIMVSNGYDEVELDDISTKIGAKYIPTPTPTPVPTKAPTATPTPTPLPHAGQTVIPVAIISTILATGIVAFIRYRKM